MVARAGRLEAGEGGAEMGEASRSGDEQQADAEPNHLCRLRGHFGSGQSYTSWARRVRP